MRIFLTEFTYKGETHDGPDIIAVAEIRKNC